MLSKILGVDTLISVIMPVFNQNKNYLEKSIDSILSQTFENFEFIIIDDGSTNEECIKTLRTYSQNDIRIKLIKNEKNVGITRSLNNALQISKGKYIARMDSDDISRRDRLEIQLENMERNPDYMLYGSWVRFIDEKGAIIGKTRPLTSYKEIKKVILKGNIFTHSTWFFKKELVDKIGPYLEIATKNEDYDFLLRTISRYKVSNIPDFLCDYRINMDSISFRNNKVQEINALKTRLRAIRKYGYPKKEYFKIIKPLLIFIFIPFTIKKYLYKFLWEK